MGGLLLMTGAKNESMNQVSLTESDVNVMLLYLLMWYVAWATS